MDIPISERIQFMQASHLFQGLAENELPAIAEAFQVVVKAVGEVIFKQDEPAYNIYMVFSGRVLISCREEDQERTLGVMVKGDYFGEGVLHGAGSLRHATARAQSNVILLAMTRENLETLIQRYARFQKNIHVSVNSRRLAHRIRFKWVRDDETVHFVVRKHAIVLALSLVIPIMIGLGGFIMLILGGFSGDSLLLGVSGILFLLSFLWGLWNWLDWSNDYYIITNQRVVWLEKVIATYDSSVDSPLSGIRNENVETTMLGRILDYGDLIVYTFIGRIVFKNIPHPYEARVFVQELRGRISEVARAEDLKTMKAAIRSRLFPEEKPAAPPVKFSPLTPGAPEMRTATAKRAGGLFSLRFEDKDTITYRKHIFVLFKQAGLPALLTIMMLPILSVLIGQSLTGESILPLSGLYTIWGVVFIFFAGWAIYQYVDWTNDIFQVTPTQIFDIDKTPLGAEQRRSAPLENILTIESDRKGILQLLFNYGTVYISITGQESMAFEDVLNPSSVQQDIDRRRLASIAKKEADKATTERERLADFFAEYYRSQEEFHREEDDKKGRSGVQ